MNFTIFLTHSVKQLGSQVYSISILPLPANTAAHCSGISVQLFRQVTAALGTFLVILQEVTKVRKILLCSWLKGLQTIPEGKVQRQTAPGLQECAARGRKLTTWQTRSRGWTSVSRVIQSSSRLVPSDDLNGILFPKGSTRFQQQNLGPSVQTHKPIVDTSHLNHNNQETSIVNFYQKNTRIIN